MDWKLKCKCKGCFNKFNGNETIRDGVTTSNRLEQGSDDEAQALNPAVGSENESRDSWDRARVSRAPSRLPSPEEPSKYSRKAPRNSFGRPEPTRKPLYIPTQDQLLSDQVPRRESNWTKTGKWRTAFPEASRDKPRASPDSKAKKSQNRGTPSWGTAEYDRKSREMARTTPTVSDQDTTSTENSEETLTKSRDIESPEEKIPATPRASKQGTAPKEKSVKQLKTQRKTESPEQKNPETAEGSKQDGSSRRNRETLIRSKKSDRTELKTPCTPTVSKQSTSFRENSEETTPRGSGRTEASATSTCRVEDDPFYTYLKAHYQMSEKLLDRTHPKNRSLKNFEEHQPSIPCTTKSNVKWWFFPQDFSQKSLNGRVTDEGKLVSNACTLICVLLASKIHMYVNLRPKDMLRTYLPGFLVTQFLNAIVIGNALHSFLMEEQQRSEPNMTVPDAMKSSADISKESSSGSLSTKNVIKNMTWPDTSLTTSQMLFESTNGSGRTVEARWIPSSTQSSS